MNRLFINYLTIPVLIFLAFTSCGGSSSKNPNLPTGENPKDYKFAASDLSRNESPNVPQSDMNELAAGNSEFAFDLYKEIKSAGGNLFYSPFSISQALAMTWAGARNNTEKQIADTLHFTLGQTGLHPAFNKLDLELQNRGQGAKGKDGKGFRLNIANSIWGQDGWSWLPDFLDTLALNYGAGMRLVDFKKLPDQCRVIINNWVEDRTEDRIKNLIPEGIITTDTRLVLVNAIYFNAAWKFPFKEENTKPGDFILLDGNKISADMMNQNEEHDYTEGDGYKACELKYDGDELSMIIVLPDSGRFDEIESSLSADFIDGIIDNLSDKSVNVTMPKYEFESQFSLADTLEAMGMPDAFSASADFSGMDGSLRLVITDVIHKAFIATDEAGTEAAAATAVILNEKGMPEFAEFKVDRPFIFLIRDIKTGAILFVGRVLNPKA